jgi:hypothetical protein
VVAIISPSEETFGFNHEQQLEPVSSFVFRVSITPATATPALAGDAVSKASHESRVSSHERAPNSTRRHPFDKFRVGCGTEKNNICSGSHPETASSSQKDLAFGKERARRSKIPPRNVHHVHQTFRFMGISGEHCSFYMFTNVHHVHPWSSFGFHVWSSRAVPGTPSLFGKRRAPQSKIPRYNVHSPQQPQKRRLPGTPIHDVQPSFCFMGLGHEHVTFPHVHDVHDVHALADG